jgi:hypothetical protein
VAKTISSGADDAAAPPDSLQLIANALGLLLCKGQNQGASIVTLFQVGFTRAQIVGLTGATKDTVKAAIYDAAQDRKKRTGGRNGKGKK